MSKKTLAGDRRRRKAITGLWVLVISVLVIVLIYKEMTAVLYILATVSVSVLLILVAVSDLAHAEPLMVQDGRTKDAQSVAK